MFSSGNIDIRNLVHLFLSCCISQKPFFHSLCQDDGNNSFDMKKFSRIFSDCWISEAIRFLVTYSSPPEPQWYLSVWPHRPYSCRKKQNRKLSGPKATLGTMNILRPLGATIKIILSSTLCVITVLTELSGRIDVMLWRNLKLLSWRKNKPMIILFWSQRLALMLYTCICFIVICNPSLNSFCLRD